MNPFAVLGIRTDATRMEVERAGQKLLAQLEIGAASVKYIEQPPTSGGAHGEGPTSSPARVERTPEMVREALTALRDPDQRIEAEMIALATPFELPAPEGVSLWRELGLGRTGPS